MRVFEVQCGRNIGEPLGHIYLDLYPRDNKYAHAAVFPLMKRAIIEGELKLPACAILCNFEKPPHDRDSLLYHDDVVVLFYEFGHAMHGICSTA